MLWVCLFLTCNAVNKASGCWHNKELLTLFDLRTWKEADLITKIFMLNISYFFYIKIV